MKVDFTQILIKLHFKSTKTQLKQPTDFYLVIVIRVNMIVVNKVVTCNNL